MLKIKNKRRVIPNIVIGLVLLVGIIWVCAKFVHLGGVEYTNNAQVNQHLTPINTRVQGFIKQICFEEYQPVPRATAAYLLRLSSARNPTMTAVFPCFLAKWRESLSWNS